MGCATSKLDDLPAVSLCRDRCNFLDQAIRHRFAFAEAHAAYLHSLKSVGLSIDRFFAQDPDSALIPQSPVLNLPAHRKGEKPLLLPIRPKNTISVIPVTTPIPVRTSISTRMMTNRTIPVPMIFIITMMMMMVVVIIFITSIMMSISMSKLSRRFSIRTPEAIFRGMGIIRM